MGFSGGGGGGAGSGGGGGSGLTVANSGQETVADADTVLISLPDYDPTVPYQTALSLPNGNPASDPVVLAPESEFTGSSFTVEHAIRFDGATGWHLTIANRANQQLTIDWFLYELPTGA